MTTRPDMHVSDFGTTLVITIYDRKTNRPVSLANALSITMIFETPDGGSKSANAELVTVGGADGKVKYIIEEDFIDVAGTWKIQVKIVENDGVGLWFSDIETFTVGENLSEELEPS
jgi:hypothetical protein